VLLLIVKPLEQGSRHLPQNFSEDFSRGRPALRLHERVDLCVGRAGRGGLDAIGRRVAMVLYDVYVIRKQSYTSDEHERALNARARELGVSEAELVRRMLDGLLLEGERACRDSRCGGTGGFFGGGRPAGGVPPLPEGVCDRPK
jgi:hypothetical protein